MVKIKEFSSIILHSYCCATQQHISLTLITCYGVHGSYLVEFRDIWSNFQMADISKERTLFLITGELFPSDLTQSYCILEGNDCTCLYVLPIVRYEVRIYGFPTYLMLPNRISVGSLDGNVLGSCLMCGSSFDDYSSRCRCTHCRMLVLVCSDCQVL